MMSILLKLCLSGYDVTPSFGAFQCEYLLQNPLFLGKNFGDRHPCKKIEPTLNHSVVDGFVLIVFNTGARIITHAPFNHSRGGGGCTVRPAGS